MQDAKPQGEIPLDGCGVDFVPEEKYSKRYCFELHTTVAKKVRMQWNICYYVAYVCVWASRCG